MEILKVSSKSNSNSIAGALANVLRDVDSVEIQAVGDSHEWVSGICDRLGVELSSLIQDVFTFASEDEEFIRYIHTIEDWMESHRPQ